MPRPASRFRSILITGASSGIGRALAIEFAAPGVSLALVGRDPARLAGTADAVAAAGAAAVTALVDVTDRQALRDRLCAWDADLAFDLVIANAGIAAGGADETEDVVRAITAVNVTGTINTLAPLLPALVARRRGHVALMASLAGFRGLPGAAAYCASKAWMRVYGDGLRLDLAPQGVGVSVICPGFVRTPMSDRAPRRPFLMAPGPAARLVRRGLEANRPRIAFPWPMAAAVWLLAALPARLGDRLLGR